MNVWICLHVCILFICECMGLSCKFYRPLSCTNISHTCMCASSNLWVFGSCYLVIIESFSGLSSAQLSVIKKEYQASSFPGLDIPMNQVDMAINLINHHEGDSYDDINEDGRYWCQWCQVTSLMMNPDQSSWLSSWTWSWSRSQVTAMMTNPDPASAVASAAIAAAAAGPLSKLVIIIIIVVMMMMIIIVIIMIIIMPSMLPLLLLLLLDPFSKLVFTGRCQLHHIHQIHDRNNHTHDHHNHHHGHHHR